MWTLRSVLARALLGSVAALAVVLGDSDRLARELVRLTDLHVAIVPEAVDAMHSPGMRILGGRPSDELYLKCLPSVAKAVRRLPQPMTAGCMRRVIIASDLKVVYTTATTGRSWEQIHLAGGTYFGSTIVVNASVIEELKFDPRWSSQVVYHEWSSLVLFKYNHLFDRKAWNKSLPRGFRYDPRKYVPHDHSQMNPTLELMEQGFITRYAQSSLENDFNMMSEFLFDGEPNLWKWYGRDGAIRKKMDAAINFYRAIDPALTVDHFRGLVHER